MRCMFIMLCNDQAESKSRSQHVINFNIQFQKCFFLHPFPSMYSHCQLVVFSDIMYCSVVVIIKVPLLILHNYTVKNKSVKSYFTLAGSGWQWGDGPCSFPQFEFHVWESMSPAYPLQTFIISLPLTHWGLQEPWGMRTDCQELKGRRK